MQGSHANDLTTGAAYVVFGKEGITSVDLHDVANGKGGYKIIAEKERDGFGRSVAGVGDVNGDGLGDLLFGAGINQGSYLVFGKTDTAAVHLSDMTSGWSGVKFINESSSGESASLVSSLGDINHDGFADLAIGRPGASNAYVVFGRQDWLE